MATTLAKVRLAEGHWVAATRLLDEQGDEADDVDTVVEGLLIRAVAQRVRSRKDGDTWDRRAREHIEQARAAIARVAGRLESRSDRNHYRRRWKREHTLLEKNAVRA